MVDLPFLLPTRLTQDAAKIKISLLYNAQGRD